MYGSYFIVPKGSDNFSIGMKLYNLDEIIASPFIRSDTVALAMTHGKFLYSPAMAIASVALTQSSHFFFPV